MSAQEVRCWRCRRQLDESETFLFGMSFGCEDCIRAFNKENTQTMDIEMELKIRHEDAVKCLRREGE